MQHEVDLVCQNFTRILIFYRFQNFRSFSGKPLQLKIVLNFPPALGNKNYSQFGETSAIRFTRTLYMNSHSFLL